MEIIMKNMNFDFQQIIEGSLNANIILDDRIIVYANKASKLLLGYNENDEMLGKRFDQFLHPEFHSICKERLRRVTENMEIAPLMEQKMFQKDGSEIDVEIMAIPYKHSNNKMMSQIVVRDITEKKHAQHLIMQTEKLSLIGELAAGIVHDIRNPITAIKGFLQLLKAEIANNTYIDIIETEIQQIEDIANELLFLAKPKETVWQVESLFDILNESVNLFSTEAFKRKININIYTGKYKKLFVLGDKVQLKQVFVNLIKNALEAINKSGEIIININKDDKYVYTNIRDNGIGIPSDKLDHIGESFFTSKKEGTGLGLMVTQNIISSHKGKIMVKSKEGIGTNFTIQLPLYPS